MDFTIAHDVAHTAGGLACSMKSGGGPPHSKTLRAHESHKIRASVLDCASPLALFPAYQSALTSNSSATEIRSVLNR
jgi:hypothetical protein